MSVMKASRKTNTPAEKTSDAAKMNVNTLFARSNWIAVPPRICEPRKKKMARTVASWNTSTAKPTNCHWETTARPPGSGNSLPMR